MESVVDLAERLSRASVRLAWDVYSHFTWPEALDPAYWMMSPELVSLYGTEIWDALDEPQQKRVSLYDVANLFSLTLNGERLLISALAGQLYRKTPFAVSSFLHHFVGEENDHMVMFGEFCQRYTGGVYPEKKVALPRKYEPGEEAVALFIKALVVEELGDVYNVAIAKDERVHPLVREINRMHHRDEARHIVFGRRYLRELWNEHAPRWSDETRVGFRRWAHDYLLASCADFYNPAAYRDAGIADAYAARAAALRSEHGREHRTRIAHKLTALLLDIGILEHAPAF
jgi:hypothetical protein